MLNQNKNRWDGNQDKCDPSYWYKKTQNTCNNITKHKTSYEINNGLSWAINFMIIFFWSDKQMKDKVAIRKTQ